MLENIFKKRNDTDAVDQYFRINKIKILITLGLILGITILALVSFSTSKYPVGFFEALDIIADHLGKGDPSTVKEKVVYDSLFPRTIAAIIVGGGLALAGAVMQSMLHNPLADPYTTGVSSGASLGASVYVVLGITLIPLGGSWDLIGNAFVFSLIPAALILLMSIFKKITSTTMILIGIGVMYMFSALTQILKIQATPQQMQTLYLWQLGSMSSCTLGDIGIMLGVVVVCSLILYRFRIDLNLLSAGDNAAVTMGTNPWRVRIMCLVVVSFMTAVVVSFTGVIGFVGLVAPQIIRMIMGSDNRYLLPASVAFGAFFLLLCDCFSRIVGSTGVPVGVVTAIIGSPLFLFLLVKQAKKDSR